MKIIGLITDAPKEDIPFSIDMWYNRPERAWVIQLKDEENTQIGDSVYVGTKTEAINQVNRWKTEFNVPLIRT